MPDESVGKLTDLLVETTREIVELLKELVREGDNSIRACVMLVSLAILGLLVVAIFAGMHWTSALRLAREPQMGIYLVATIIDVAIPAPAVILAIPRIGAKSTARQLRDRVRRAEAVVLPPEGEEEIDAAGADDDA